MQSSGLAAGGEGSSGVGYQAASSGLHEGLGVPPGGVGAHGLGHGLGQRPGPRLLGRPADGAYSWPLTPVVPASCPLCPRRFFTRVTNTFISVNESLAEYGFMVGCRGAPRSGSGFGRGGRACLYRPQCMDTAHVHIAVEGLLPTCRNAIASGRGGYACVGNTMRLVACSLLRTLLLHTQHTHLPPLPLPGQGLAVTLVTLGALYARWRVVVSPAAVYRQAMVRLNTHPGVLEVGRGGMGGVGAWRGWGQDRGRWGKQGSPLAAQCHGCTGRGGHW